MDSGRAPLPSSARPTAPVRRTWLAVVVVIASLAAGFGTGNSAGANQDPQGPGPDGKQLLSSRWEQLRRTGNPFSAREILYQMQREQHEARARATLARREELVERNRDVLRQQAVESVMAPDREPSAEIRRAEQRREEARALAELLDRELTTREGRIGRFLRTLVEERRARPSEDLAVTLGTLVERFTATGTSPDRTAPQRVDGVYGPISGTVGFIGEPDTALTMDSEGIVFVFDEYGFPLRDRYDYVSSYSTSWSVWVDPGVYYPVLLMPGYATLYWDGVTGSEHSNQAVTVVKDSFDVEDVDFRLPTGATISGQLTDTEGSPVGGYTGDWQLFEATEDPNWYWNADYPIYATAYIDTNGFYTIRGIRPGSYYMVYRGRSYNERWYDGTGHWQLATPITFPDRATDLTGIDFTEYDGWSLTGRLFNSDGATPLGDTAGGASTVASVMLQEKLPAGSPVESDPNTFYAYVYSSSDSYFHFSYIPEGEYYVYVQEYANQGYAATYWEGQTYSMGSGVSPSSPERAAAPTPDLAAFLTLTLADSTLADTLAVVMDDGATIKGHLLAPDGSGFYPGYIYMVHETLEGDWWYSASTDATGYFSVDVLPAGQYSVHTYSTALDYYYDLSGGTFDESSRALITLTEGQVDSLGTWQVPAGGSIYATVTDSSKGTPATGDIWLYDASGQFLTATYAGSGQAMIDWLPPDTYYAFLSGYSNYGDELWENGWADQDDVDFDPTVGTPIVVAIGETDTLDFLVESFGIIEGEIKEDGLSDFWPYYMNVEVWDAHNPRRLIDYYWNYNYGPFPTSAEDGPSRIAATDSITFRIYGLEPGDYKIRIVEPIQEYGYYMDASPADPAGAERAPYSTFTGTWPGQFYKSGTPATDGATNWIDAETVTVAAMGDTIRGVDFTLEGGATIFGTINYAGSDTVGVSVGSLGVFVLLFDATSGGFVDSQDGTIERLNSMAGGFQFHSVMPGSYKLAAAGLWGGQAVTWYSTSGPVNDFASASTITVSAGEELELFHFINPVDQGATIDGSVSMLGPDDPSEFSWVFAISPEGYPAGVGYTGDMGLLFHDLEDLYYSYYGEVAAEEKSVGSYAIAGLPDGTYHLRSWSPNLLYVIFEYLHEVEERSPAEDPARNSIADYPAYLYNLQDMWYDQVPAGPLTDFLEWETDFASGPVPTGATPVTITGGVSQSDIDFYLAVLALGDPNGDGVFDIGDVISLVNAILRISPFGPNQISAADLNSDGIADIGDVVSMIISLLGGSSASGPDTVPSGEFLVALGTPDVRASAAEIPVWTRFSQSLAGLQLEFEVSDQADVVAAGLPAGVTLASHRAGDRLRVLVYSTQGSELPAEETCLLRILRPGATGETAAEGIRFLGARGATANGAALSLQSFDIGEGPIGLGSRYILEDNWPNPFNPTTTIAFTLPHTSRVRLRVYNIRGQVVKTLVDHEMGGGRHTVQWDGTDAAGRKVATGIYLYTFEADRFRASKKMLFVK